jgi:hypothetical protein
MSANLSVLGELVVIAVVCVILAVAFYALVNRVTR